MLPHALCFRFIFSMILFSNLLVSRFLLPAVSSPQTKNTRSTYASDAAADNVTVSFFYCINLFSFFQFQLQLQLT